MPAAYNSQSAPGGAAVNPVVAAELAALLPCPSQHPVAALNFHPHNPQLTLQTLPSSYSSALWTPCFITQTASATQKTNPDRVLFVSLRALLPVPLVYHLKGTFNFDQSALVPLYFSGVFLNYSPEVLVLNLINLNLFSKFWDLTREKDYPISDHSALHLSIFIRQFSSNILIYKIHGMSNKS